MRRIIGLATSVVLATGSLVALTSSPASGVIASSSGALTQIAPPPSAQSNALPSTTALWAWNEQQGITLASNVRVDINAPGNYETPGSIVTSTIPAGTVVDSHYFFADHTGANVVTGTATFAADIVGIIIGPGRLDQTDVLGSPTTVYPGTISSRGLELGTTEDAVLMPNLRTVTIRAHAGAGIDQVRVLTRHNSAPTVNAGGPYAGVEGSPVALNATAVDPEGSSVTVGWTFAVNGGSSAVCTPTGTATLTPTITCDDDATVTATLTAADPFQAASTTTAQIAISNRAPTLDAIAIPSTPQPLGTAVAVTGTFADAGTRDSHVVDVQWGDTTSSGATVTEASGTGSYSASHTYAIPGVYVVSVTVTDDNLGFATSSGFLVVNGPPTADAAGPYLGDEGTAAGLVGTATDPEDDPLTTLWTFGVQAASPGTACTYASITTLAPNVTCDDAAVLSARLTTSDGVNPAVVSDSTVTINNVAPVLGTTAATSGPIPVGGAVSVSVPFTDAGTHDTHTATVDWGDTTSNAAVVSESAGAGTASSTHQYAQPGVYRVVITVTDDEGSATAGEVEVTVNAPPTADAGGPYVGFEGAPMYLVGTATDANADPLATNWTFTWTGAPGTLCTATGTTTLTPTIVCTDDAVVTATLTVDDGINAPVSSSATLTVGNVTPVVGAAVPSAARVSTGSTVSVSQSFTDAGANDIHTATIAWGDTTTSAGTVTEADGSGTVSATHEYATAGTYTITVTATDDDGSAASTSTSVVVNAAPTGNAGGPYSGAEGDPVALTAHADDPDDDALTTTWAITWTGAPGTGCTITGETTLTPDITCDDDATVDAVLTISDGVNDAITRTATVTVGNAAPVLGALSGPGGVVPRTTDVTVHAELTDAGAHDTHTATIDWGDGTIEAVSVTGGAGSGSIDGTHAYATHGTYTVRVTVADDDGATDTRTTSIVVNDAPSVGAGGPYSGDEGGALPLHATAVDPDADGLSISWTHTITSSDPGTTCSVTNDDTLDPILSCDDDAEADLTVTIDDGVNAPVHDTTTATVDNAAPVVTSISATPLVAAEGATTTVAATFADPSTHDTHTATIDWGDGTTTSALILEQDGAGSVGGTHVYDSYGTYHITVIVTDDDGAEGTATQDIRVDAAPLVNVGGPYAGVEGAAVTLGATASDADTPNPAILWTSTTVADPGTVCALTGATTLTPAVTCTDDATVQVTLTVDDGVNPAIVQTATVTIANVAPAVATPSVSPNPVATGGTVTLHALFTDVGVNDTHVASVNWGNGTTTAAVTDGPGSGEVDATHVYPVSGTYTVRVTVNDQNGGSSSASTVLSVNAAPTASAGGPYTGTEGAPIALSATATDPEGDLLGRTWAFTYSAAPGATCTMTGTATLTPALTCTDDATAQVSLTVSDGTNAPVTSATTVTVTNAAPTIGGLQAPTSPVSVNTVFSVQGTFADLGVNDVHSATIDWGDSTTSPATVVESNGSGAITASHSYAAVGSYAVTLTVTDDDGGTATFAAVTPVSVYVPAGRGFTIGAGLLSSPSQAVTPANTADANTVGYAQFEFNARTNPDNSTRGNIEFQMQSAGLHFHGEGPATLSVSGSAAKVTVTGRIEGKGRTTEGYSATVWAIDGGKGADRFRIRIWQTATGTVLYDNQYASPLDAAPTQAPSTGSILVKQL